MKKIVLTLAIALGAITASNAQDVGRMWVGGTAGFWSSKISGYDAQLNFKLMPEVGYILNENLGVGIALGGAHTHAGSDGGDLKFDGETLNGKTSKNTYTVNPFLRYTFLKGDIGGLFVDGGIAYNHTKITNGGPKGDGIEVGFRPGVAINVSNKVAIVGKFGFLGWQYSHVKGTFIDNQGYVYEGAKHSNDWGFDFDLSNIQLGANIKF